LGCFLLFILGKLLERLIKMRVAVFSDIHSNSLALINVLEDIKKEDFDKIFCLGDLVGYGPSPNRVIEIMRNSEIPTIIGNYDEGVGYEKGECGCAYSSP
jgi:predicted phosphodiesterase